MRSSRYRTAVISVPTLLGALFLTATAEAEGELELRGLVSAGYSHSFQSTSLNPGGSLSDGNGIDVLAGFEAGEYLAFMVGWQWQSESDFDTHYFPISMRAYSPRLLQDRVRLYGQFGLGLLYARLHNELNDNRNGNDSGAAVRAGLGVEVGITEDISGIVYSSFLWGLGSIDDYDSGTVGVGVQYHWGL